MAVRIEVQPDGTIEMIRTYEGRTKFLKFDSLDKAIAIAEYLLKRDSSISRNDRFVPQLKIEARKEFKRLEAEARERRNRR